MALGGVRRFVNPAEDRYQALRLSCLTNRVRSLLGRGAQGWMRQDAVPLTNGNHHRPWHVDTPRTVP